MNQITFEQLPKELRFPLIRRGYLRPKGMDMRLFRISIKLILENRDIIIIYGAGGGYNLSKITYNKQHQVISRGQCVRTLNDSRADVIYDRKINICDIKIDCGEEYIEKGYGDCIIYNANKIYIIDKLDTTCEPYKNLKSNEYTDTRVNYKKMK